jgi:hypothetical protein
MGAYIPLVPIDERIAISATLGEPVGQRNERTFCVVRMQQIRYEQKEVKQPSFGKRSANRFSTFSFAELFIPDMRMGHVVADGCRSRIESDDMIGVDASAPDSIPMEPDGKWSQIDAFELNWCRGDGQRFISAVVRPIAKLIVHSHEIPMDLGCRCQVVGCGRG